MDINDLLTVPDAAAEAGVTPQTIRNWGWRGQIERVTLGDRVYVVRESLRRRAAENEKLREKLTAAAARKNGEITGAEREQAATM